MTSRDGITIGRYGPTTCIQLKASSQIGLDESHEALSGKIP